MKATESKDLIVGRVYSDSENIDEETTFLKHNHFSKEGAPRMDFVGGEDKYFLEDGVIPFPKDAGFFYLLSKKELKQYLPKEKP